MTECLGLCTSRRLPLTFLGREVWGREIGVPIAREEGFMNEETSLSPFLRVSMRPRDPSRGVILNCTVRVVSSQVSMSTVTSDTYPRTRSPVGGGRGFDLGGPFFFILFPNFFQYSHLRSRLYGREDRSFFVVI